MPCHQDQNGHLTNGQTDIAIPEAMLPLGQIKPHHTRAPTRNKFACVGGCEGPGKLNLSWLLFSSHWEEEAGCVLVQADILTEWVDCRGVSTVPCLRAAVNFTGSNQSAFLHLDEESVLLAPEVFSNCVRLFRSRLVVLS